MLNEDLKVGDVVYLKPESSFRKYNSSLNPLNTKGVVVSKPVVGFTQGIMVQWEGVYPEVWYPISTRDFILNTNVCGKFPSRKSARDFAKKNNFVVVDLGKDQSPRWTVGVKEV